MWALSLWLTCGVGTAFVLTHDNPYVGWRRLDVAIMTGVVLSGPLTMLIVFVIHLRDR